MQQVWPTKRKGYVMKRNVLYYGWLSHQNLGDEALFESSKRVFTQIKLIPFIPLLNRLSQIQLDIVTYMHRPIACLVGGGTLIYTPQITFYQAIQKKLPLYFFGAGVEDLQHKGNAAVPSALAQQWNSLLECAAAVSVRGPHSQRLLEQHGYYDAALIGDPALSLADDHPLPKQGHHIAINFGDTDGNLWGGDDKSVYDFCKSLALSLLQEGYRISLFSVYPKDTPLLTQLQQELQNKVELQIYYQYSAKMMDFLRGVDVLIGQKLHAVILAHCVYTPAIMLEYRPKCRDYMASMELEALNFRCDQLSQNEVLAALENIRINGTAHQKHLLSKITHYKDLQLRFARMLPT